MLHDCFILKLKALYDIETQVMKALPKMIERATSQDLKEAFRMHFEETKGQVNRLERIFELLELKPSKVTVEGIRGIMDDMRWAMKQKGSTAAIDALLIASSQYIEHYEMAGYSAMISWAKAMNHAKALELLEETLTEEEAANQKLMLISEEINKQASI